MKHEGSMSYFCNTWTMTCTLFPCIKGRSYIRFFYFKILEKIFLYSIASPCELFFVRVEVVIMVEGSIIHVIIFLWVFSVIIGKFFLWFWAMSSLFFLPTNLKCLIGFFPVLFVCLRSTFHPLTTKQIVKIIRLTQVWSTKHVLARATRPCAVFPF
jgi:hypothetical protein